MDQLLCISNAQKSLNVAVIGMQGAPFGKSLRHTRHSRSRLVATWSSSGPSGKVLPLCVVLRFSLHGLHLQRSNDNCCEIAQRPG